MLLQNQPLERYFSAPMFNALSVPAGLIKLRQRLENETDEQANS
jgi:hypothetical protein